MKYLKMIHVSEIQINNGNTTFRIEINIVFFDFRLFRIKREVQVLTF